MNRRLFASCIAVLLAAGCSGGGGKKNAAPSAKFSFSCTELRCSFADESADSDGTIHARAWAFGDGSTSTDASPVHTYGAPGTFTVTLTVTDDGGATGSTSQTVTMNLPPRASFDLTCSVLTCDLTDGSTDVAGKIVSRSWSFGDGTTSAETNPRHVYAAGGTYDITLTVTDDGGMTGTTTRTVSVAASPGGSTPVAAFSISCASDTCDFHDQSTDTGGTLTTWSWDFGDGSAPSTSQNPRHTYSVSALTEFTVRLTVTDNLGATSTASKSFNVSPPAGLVCRDAANPGDLTACAIVLDRAARLEIEVTARECGARGNTFTVTSPVVQTIWTDLCYDPPLGTVVTLSDNGAPFAAGTVLVAEMISGATKQVIAPSLIVIGSTSPWQVQFDDGQVAPADLDILLTIREVP
jgi:PKD repeat protein